MKKTFFWMASAFLLSFVSCSDDCDHQTGPIHEHIIDIVGDWYESDMNEEIRYAANGTFYDRYALFNRCGETEGSYELDAKNKKLTWRYFMGEAQFADWSIKEATSYQLTIYSSTVAEHTAEKIVEKYHLAVGETATIKIATEDPTFAGAQFSSKNERVAAVSAEGVITAMGEKGTTYIKVSSGSFNVWVRVTVGDDCADLWADYVSVIGQDYVQMRKTLAVLGEPVMTGEDGYSFAFKHQLHDLIEYTNVFLCPEDGQTTEIQLQLFDAVSESSVLAYMNAHYYKALDADQLVFYSNVEDLDHSKAIIVYDKENKKVIFCETEHFFERVHVKDLWTDFTPLFGKGKNEVKNEMNKLGSMFLMSDYSYSENGSDYYSVTGSDYASLVGFVFNPDEQMSEFWVYMNDQSNLKDVNDYLSKVYTLDQSESTNTALTFYNADRSIRVVLDLNFRAVIYTNLTMKQHQTKQNILGDYYQGLGLSAGEIISAYGTPDSNDGKSLLYMVGNAYVQAALFSISETTQKCNVVGVLLAEGVETATIVDFLNSKYTVYANGTAADGSQYAWTDGPTVVESSMGIIYSVTNGMVIYQQLGGTSKAKQMNLLISSPQTCVRPLYNVKLRRDKAAAAGMQSIQTKQPTLIERFVNFHSVRK